VRTERTCSLSAPSFGKRVDWSRIRKLSKNLRSLDAAAESGERKAGAEELAESRSRSVERGPETSI